MCTSVHILTDISPQENESHLTASQYVCVSVCVCVSHGVHLSTEISPQEKESYLTACMCVCLSVCKSWCVPLSLLLFNRYISTSTEKWITSHRFSVCVHVCVYLSVCVPLSLLLFNRYRSTSTGNESHLTSCQCVGVCLCLYLFLSFSTNTDIPPQKIQPIQI